METNNPIIADTSALISLVHQADTNNQKAVAISTHIRRIHRFLIVPGDVFAETINTLGKRFGHEQAAMVGNTLLDPEAFQIIETTPEVRLAALDKFRAQPGSVSFTDCVVMAVADVLATTEVFGFDEVFAKNGYLLPSPT